MYPSGKCSLKIHDLLGNTINKYLSKILLILDLTILKLLQ